MRKITKHDLAMVLGAGDENSQLINDIASNAAWGAVLGAMGGPATIAAGAIGGVVQTVVQGAYNHGPVNVPIPVMIGPGWNGSGGSTSTSSSSSADSAA